MFNGIQDTVQVAMCLHAGMHGLMHEYHPVLNLHHISDQGYLYALQEGRGGIVGRSKLPGSMCYDA